jgi:hypothetical protein
MAGENNEKVRIVRHSSRRLKEDKKHVKHKLWKMDE